MRVEKDRSKLLILGHSDLLIHVDQCISDWLKDHQLNSDLLIFVDQRISDQLQDYKLNSDLLICVYQRISYGL